MAQRKMKPKMKDLIPQKAVPELQNHISHLWRVPKKCLEKEIQNSPSGENMKKKSASSNGTQQPENNSHKNKPTGIRQLSIERNDDWVLKVRHHDTRISGHNHSDDSDSSARLGVLRQSSHTSMPRSQQDCENVCP